MNNFPTYVLIDGETPVKIEKNGVIISAQLVNGSPYPPIKAMSEGIKITQEEFNRRAKAFPASS